MNAKLVDVTIIGGGPVGLFAAFYAGLRGMSVRIIDSLPELGGQLTALYPEKYVYDMPGFPKVLARDLAKEMAEQALQFHPELILEDTAETLEQVNGQWSIVNGEESEHRTPNTEHLPESQHSTLSTQHYLITTRNGLQLPTRTIIISAGAGAFSPTKIGIEREAEFEEKGIFYGVKNKAHFEDKKLIVVGGGDSAFDWALNLEPIAKEITLVHRRDQFKAHEDSVKKLQESRVGMKLWYTVKELHGNGNLHAITLEHTQTKETEHMEIDAVIVNVGFKSSLGPIKTWGLNIEKNQIVVDNRYETNLPGVFAVGDVCSFEGKLKLIATGVGEAATAVCFAKQHLDPAAKLFPGHSSDMEMPTS